MVVIPEGRYAGRKFRVDRAPWCGHFFDAVDSGLYNRFASTGPVQSGKTLSTVVLPALWHLFEWRESVILGVPSMDMAYDKWRQEFLPVIHASPALRSYLADRGRGSRGGTFESITFTNGATLKIMSGHGGDEKRSAYTARVVVITEADKMDEAGEASREADPITQLEARTASFAEDKRIYVECTVSIEEGRIWREYTQGSTHTQIVCTCPSCRADQAVDREHLRGWSAEEAADEMQAAQEAHFHCTACGIVWDEDERRQMNLTSRAVHRRDRTSTFGLRWNAFNNLFWPAGWIGAKEWRRAQHDADDVAGEAAERELRQFVWALPAAPDKFAAIELDAHALCERGAGEGTEKFLRGIVPPDAEVLSMGVDVGLHTLYWVLIAWRPGGVAHVVEYGVWDVPGSSMAPERAVLTGLLSFADERVRPGWPDLRNNKPHWPACVLVDAGYQPDAVFEFVRRLRKTDPQHPRRFIPALGRGTSQRKSVAAPAPKIGGGKVVHPGHFYDVKRYENRGGAYGVEINADHWKSDLHARLATPAGAAGSLVFHHVHKSTEHLTITKHLTAEKVEQEFVPGKGIVDQWTNKSRRPNHYFDASYLAIGAGHLCGQGVREPAASAGQAVAPTQPFTLPDGRPYFVGERD